MSSHRTALVRRPSDRLAEGLVTHIDREPIDLAVATKQWEAYAAALDATGWNVIEVPPSPPHPDSVFVEDTAVMFGNLAVIARPGAAQRRGEVGPVAAVLAGLGYELAELAAPATLDGGDILKVGRTAYVGLSGRTNAAAIEQLRSILDSRGWEVTAVPLTKALHLKSAVTALPDGTIIGWEPVVDDRSPFPGFTPMPEEPGAHVVDLGEGRVMIEATATASQRLLRERGYTTVPVEVGEFAKLEGCVTCLSIRLRDTPG